MFAGAGHAFYTQPHYRQDIKVISSTIAGSLVLLSAEGALADAYAKTAAGQAEARRAREEGALLYRHAREVVLRPGVLGGLVGLCELFASARLGGCSFNVPI